MKNSRTIVSAIFTAALLSTTAWGNIITVNNPSFETGTLPFACGTGCAFSVGAIPSWTNGGTSGQFQPGEPTNTTYFNTKASDSSATIAYSDGGTISQTVGATVQTGVVYTLLVDLGQRNDVAFAGTADLLVNGIKYLATGVVPVRGNWSTFTATYTGLAADVGDAITIELNATAAEGDFDNVRLNNNLTGAVPEPAFTSLVGISFLLFAGLRRFKARP